MQSGLFNVIRIFYNIIYILTFSYFISSIIFQYHSIQIIIVDSHISLELACERSTYLSHGFANRIEAIKMSRFQNMSIFT